MEFYLRNRVNQNEILAKKALVQEYKNTQTIFIGNSHGRNAFIPQLIDSSALNLCIGGSIAYYDAYFFKEVLKELPKLKYLIYNISYQTLYYDLELLEDKRKKYEFFNYLGVDAGVRKSSPNNWSTLCTIGLYGGVQNLISDYFGENTDWAQTMGYKPESEMIDLDKIQESAQARLSIHHSIMSQQELPDNLACLQAMQDLADANDVKIIYILLPVIKAYQDGWDYKYKDFERLSKQFADENNATLINLSDSLKLTDHHFVDPDHLNSIGAQKVSEFIYTYFKDNNY